MAGKTRTEARHLRHRRVRRRVYGTEDRPRLNVFRSSEHIYAQLVNDEVAHTVVAVSTLDAEVRGQLLGLTKIEGAKVVGRIVASRAQGKGIKQVVFDRGGYAYHGRVKALAEASREAGLEF